MITSLDVYIWESKVGTLVLNKVKYKDQICFYYDSDFIKGNIDIAPLRASIYNEGVKNGFPIYADKDKIFGGLPSFIADSLPDNWGATVFREWCARKGIKMKSISPLDRLAYIGCRGMGALEFRPPIVKDLETSFPVDIRELYMVADQTYQEKRNLRLSLTEDLRMESLMKIGTSAGGRHPKAILNVNMSTGECLSGQVPPPNSDFTPVIIKFDEKLDIPNTRIEYSYYLLAQRAGLKMMPSNIIEIDGNAHFITQRFDRKDGEKIHVQTLAAMEPYSSSYEDLLRAAVRLNLPMEDLKRIFISMVLNVVCGNIDDHNKNFSFLMEKSGLWRLAPAYDFTYTVDKSAPEYVNRHSMSLNGKIDNFELSDLLTLAHQYNINNALGAIEAVVEATKDYEKFAGMAGVPEDWVKVIQLEFKENIDTLYGKS